MFTHPSFHLFDIILWLIVVLSTLYGLWRGFIKEFIALVIWLVVLFIAIHYMPTISHYLHVYIRKQHVVFILTIVILALIAILLGLFVNLLFSFLLNVLPPSFVNHVIGGLFGFIRGVVLITLLVYLLAHTSWQKNALLTESTTAKTLLTVINKLQPAKLIKTKINYFN